MMGSRAALLALTAFSLAVSCRTSNSQTPTHERDWALFKSLYVNGTAFFAPIIGIGGNAVAMGFSQETSVSFVDMYIDKSTFRREGALISFDMVWALPRMRISRLHRNVQIDCSTRTYIMPTWQRFSGPMATGEPENDEKTYMKKWKNSGDLKAEDLAYFCEGPSRSAVPSSKEASVAPDARP